MYRSTHSLFVSQFSRRSLLKGAAARGAAAIAAPAYITSALSSSGSLNIINWDDELPNPLIPNFEKATGIKVNSTPFSQNEEQINKLQATGGEGFDVCQPTHDRALQFKDIDVLQPIDPAKWDPTSVVVPGLLSASTKNWTWDGKLYHVPHVWGTEAISWRNDLTKVDPDGAFVRHAVERRIQGQGAGPAAFAAARHRPVDGRERQAADQPDARRLSRTRRR